MYANFWLQRKLHNETGPLLHCILVPPCIWEAVVYRQDY